MKRTQKAITTALWEWIEEYVSVMKTQQEPSIGQGERIRECREEISLCIQELLESE